MGNPTPQCLKRLQIELRKLAAEPDAAYQINADPHNMLRCYFVMNGPEGTPYAGGRYIGLLEIPAEYPFKPPSVQLCTPSGRFRTGMAICLSNSSYHPEQWSPMWGLRTILIALVSFFVSNEATTGSMESSDADRRQFAANSRQYNVERIKTVYKRVLPDAYEKDVEYLKNQQQQKASDAASSHSEGDGSTDEDEEGDDEEVRKLAKVEHTPMSAEAVTGTTVVTPQPSKDSKSSAKDDADGAGDSAADQRAGEAVEAEGKPGDADAKHRRHHHKHHSHSKLGVELQTTTVFQLGGVPWRRWASLAVLLVVAVALVEQLR